MPGRMPTTAMAGRRSWASSAGLRMVARPGRWSSPSRSFRASTSSRTPRPPRHWLMRLIDSHGHIQADRFVGDVELVLGGARLAGVERILVPGWDPDSSAAALELVGRYPWLDAAVGVHPHDAATVDEAGWAGIVALAADARVRAIGETGLDSDRGFSPFADQLVNLRRN